MNIHGYPCLLYSRILMVQFYIYEYSSYKSGISRIFTMNILELFSNIHELFMFMKEGYLQMLYPCKLGLSPPIDYS